MHGEEAEIRILEASVVGLNGSQGSIPFYITEDDDPLLVGNNIVSKSNLLGAENIIDIPPNTADISKSRLGLPTYTVGEDFESRTFLHLVPSRLSQLSTYFASISSFNATQFEANDGEDDVGESRFHNSKHARMFAVKLHTFAHLTPRDIKTICKRAGILTSILSQALDSVYEKCVSCKMTERPAPFQKVSFSRLLDEFNSHVQVDFLFIRELGNLPILNMTDVATGFTVTSLLHSRSMNETASTIVTKWFDVHGRPKRLSGDPEFNNETITLIFAQNSVTYEARPARRHNKIGSVESGNDTIRLFVQRLLRDKQNSRQVGRKLHTDYEILSRATFLKNIMYGGKHLSSFELARGYRPSLFGLPQHPVSAEILQAHKEQVARRAVHAFIRSRNTSSVSKDILPPRTKVYFYRKVTNRGEWLVGDVLSAESHIVHVCHDAPTSSLLQELDDIELGITSCAHAEKEVSSILR